MQRETKKKNMIQKYGKFKSTPSMQRETRRKAGPMGRGGV